MFRSQNLFQDIPCPSTYSDPPKQCVLIRCFFNHDLPVQQKNGGEERPLKRRRVEEAGRNEASSSSATPQTPERAKHSNPLKRPPPTVSPIPAPKALKPTATSTPGTKILARNSIAAPRSQLGQAVSPIRAAPARPVKPAAVAVPLNQTLRPRLVKNAPEGFETRIKLLKLLHAEHTRLYELPADDAALIDYTLTEEEKLAKEKGKAYATVTKLLITKMRKLKPEEFLKEREDLNRTRERRLTGKEISPPPEKKKVTDPMEFRVDTELTKEEELEALKELVHSERELKEYGYVLQPIEDKEIDEMKKALVSLGGLEPCERCGTRFQVFPGRNEAGLLTSAGKCTFHWGKPMMTQIGERGLATSREKRYTCCGEEIGREGCSECPNHVFGTRSPIRASVVMPYVVSPESSGPVKAYSLDCEMGYTTYGFEPIRVTLLNYPEHTRALDALIRPFGEILDLNTRFSGVSREQFTNATPYTLDTPTDALSANPSPDTPMPILSSPLHARQLLLDHFINSSTILIGHALDNDLNTLRICHNQVIDTAILYPHSRGLPARNKLRWIVQRTLGLTIQADEKTEGEEVKGHDSALDARMAAECVRFRLKGGKGWKKVERKQKRKENAIDGVGATLDRMREAGESPFQVTPS